MADRARRRAKTPAAYAIVDAQGRAVGIFTLMAIRPEHRVIEVGHVVYAPALQRTPLATEAQYLLARYVFETLALPALRMEMQLAQRSLAARGAALRFRLSKAFSAST